MQTSAMINRCIVFSFADKFDVPFFLFNSNLETKIFDGNECTAIFTESVYVQWDRRNIEKNIHEDLKQLQLDRNNNNNNNKEGKCNYLCTNW